MTHIETMILGAGIAGLGAALRCREEGKAAIIFEANERAGGLLDNFEIDGFLFDNAVHLSFATEPKVREIFDKTPYITHPADAWNFEKDRWLKHPVQNNLFPLSAEDKVELITSFLTRPEDAGVDYESWLRHQYGDKIAERYPIKYTVKYWGTPAKNLSTSWIGSRMRRAEVEEILFGAFTDQTPNTYYVKEMRYPEYGGYRSFIEPLIEQSDIRLNHRATKIDLVNKTVTFNDVQTVSYDSLVNTIPLPHFIELCIDVPDNVSNSAKELMATSIDLISIGFNKPIIKDLWFYIYDEDILASRAYSPSVKSPNNTPDGCSSLQFEIYSRGTNSRYSVDELKANTIMALKKMNVATEDDILFIHHKNLPYGNVIFDIGMEENRQIIKEFLNKNRVLNCGRFGEWDYLWSNQSLMSGYNIIEGIGKSYE